MSATHPGPVALSLSVTGDDRKRLEGKGMITEARGLKCLLLRGHFGASVRSGS